MQFQKLDDYVKYLGGTRPLNKVLIANNGIAAVKAIRSVRRWCYEVFGREREIKFVAMATPEDLKANAEFIRMADEVVEVPGGRNLNNYANVDLIVQTAKKYQVDGVWPGWGHASENPSLPTSLEACGIVFIGPPAGPMYALGDKIGSTIIAQNADVPVIAWNGADIKFNYKAEYNIPPEVYNKACIQSSQECLQAVERIGLPVMIKASEGGGGKGIRKVTEISNVEAAFRQVQSEVPGSPIFVMKLASKSRHLEVQLLCDKYGQAIALSGRDCSVQRRHQKILEEGPPSAAEPSVWREMERAAVRLAKEVNYINAGTVEYLYREEDKTFCFLELNPRLQVEHPVTEMITGVNLPASQFQVAMGIPLNRIPDIRRYYKMKDIYGDDKIDFDNTEPRGPEGHVIAARITAENPNKGFQPTSGRIEELNFRSSRNVWGYFSVDSSGRVHEFADSQFGHLFAWGENRDVARKHLALALNDMSIRGDIRTTIEYLKDLLEDPGYRSNAIDTTWLDERIRTYKQAVMIDHAIVALVGAGCECFEQALKQEAEYVSQLSRGQLPNPQLLSLQFKSELIFENIKYILTATRTGPSTFNIELNGQIIEQEIRSLADGGYLVLMGGKSHVAYLKPEIGAKRLVMDGQTYLFVDEYDPSQVRAAMGGKLLRFLVEDGASVKKDFPIAEIEVMKMTMPLLAPENGTVTIVKPAGSVMEPGDVICTFLLDDISKIHKSEVFKGAVPNMGPPNPRPGDDMPHHILSQAVSVLNNIMEGYSVPLAKRQTALAEFNLAQTTPLLPALELADLLSRIKNTMPYALHDELREISKDFRKQVDESVSSQGKGIKASMSATNLLEAGSSSPVHANSDGQSDKNINAYQFVPQYAQKVTKAVADFIANSSGDAKSQAEAAAPQINAIVSKYLGGLQAYALGLASSLLRKYLDVESCFAELELSDSPVKDEALQELRRRHSANLRTVFDLALSHAAVKSKNVCALELLEKVENCVRKDEEMPISDPLVNSTVRDGAVKLLRDIAALNVESTNDVALESRQMLIELQKPSYHQSLTNIQETLRKVAGGDVEARSSLINSTEAILHMIMDIMLNSKDEVLKQAALEVYVRRVYNTYSLVDFETRKLGQSSGQVAAWHFYSDAETYGSNVSQIPQGMLNAQSSANLQALLSAEYQGDDELISISKSDSVTNLADDAAIGSKRKMFSKQKSSRARAGSGWEGESGDDSTSVKSAGLGDADSNSASGLNLSIHANAGGKFSGGEGVPTNIVRHGILSYFDGLDSLKENFSLLLSQFDTSTQAEGDKPVNALHIVLREKISPNDVVASPAPLTRQKSSALQLGEESTATRLSSFLAENQAALRKAGVRRVTFAVPTLSSGQRQTIVAGHGSGFFTFRESANFLEDRLVRHIETPLAFQLELKRLSNFNISLVPLGKNLSMSHTVHVYQAIPKKSEGGAAAGGGGDDDGEGGGSGGATKRRFFVRALVRQAGKVQSTPSDDESAVYSYPGPERVLVQALAALEAIQGGSGANSILGAQNHIFLNVLGDASVDPLTAERICRVIARRYAKRLLTARVAEVELKFNTRLDSESPQIPVRIISSNPTGFALRVDSYIEAVDPLDPNRTLLYSISASDGGVGASLAAMGLDLGTSSASASNAAQDVFSFGDTDNDHDIEGLHSSTSGTGSITGLGSFHGLESTFPYPVSTPFEERRARAIAAGTCFVYDIPALFQKALENQWRSYSRRRDHIAIPSSSTLLKAQELVLDDEMDATGSQLADSGLVFTSRPPGSNKIAMVAWLFHMVTPQYSSGNGREVMIIANDLTFKAGSFGTREDELFARASKYARERGIPRLYIAANSGARIGIAEEVKRAFRVKWVDDNDPSKGFSYVYVDPNEYKLLGPEGRKSVISEPVYDESNNIIHYKLTAIVGEGRDLGVENLRGSGMIAGETSRAYEETFTATYVAGRTVGIGAYLVRLGQRTIQKGTNAPIILTGYQALNSLMGRAVYSSNAQLGGPAIMYNNGVTHMCVRDDLEGISSLLTWLTYVPERKGLSLPLTTLYSGDSIERDVEYMPSPDVISDPRLMLAGVESSTGWVSGLFDRGSWMELLGGWAKTIITGRARLGCIPVGVVIPESRTVECKKPADPATLDSKETLIMQAGNVWFPDSSYKTAQAIRDINNEGLPLVFIANFRGFSGGQRDMFDEVLKYGSMIVDALVDFKQPVIVYLPPFGELRGGAWVVMDATINEDMMEMYAAPEARGGVLEPAGTVSIKFRTKDMIAAMHRVDPAIIELDKQLAKAEEAKSSADDLKKIKTLIEQREKKLMPVYKQLALEVADLHDRPGRMMAKKVISGVVPWRESRRFFYWRLRRRLAEDEVCKQLMKEGELKSLAVARETLKKIGEVAISSVSPTSWTADDRGVVEWIQSAQGGRSIEALKTALRQERIVKQLTDLGMQDSTAVLKGIMGIIQTLSQNGRTSERDQFVQTLRRGVFLLGTGSSGSTSSNNGSASS